jgi:hypothetical protein
MKSMYQASLTDLCLSLFYTNVHFSGKSGRGTLEKFASGRMETGMFSKLGISCYSYW